MAGCSLEVPEFLGSTPKAALFCEGSEFKDSAQAEHRPRGSWAWCLLVALACSQRGLRIEPKAHRACGTGHTARPAWSCLLPCAVWTGHHLKHRARRTRHRAALGIEPRTSRTRSENHATRPSSLLVRPSDVRIQPHNLFLGACASVAMRAACVGSGNATSAAWPHSANAHCGAWTHDDKLKGLAPCQLS